MTPSGNGLSCTVHSPAGDANLTLSNLMLGQAVLTPLSSLTRASLAAVLGTDAGDEGGVCFEGAVILDIAIQRLTFEEMTGGVAIATGFCPLERVGDQALRSRVAASGRAPSRKRAAGSRR